MKICPQCKNQTGDDTENFCYQDGAVLERVPTCSCGAQLLRMYKFCTACGKKVEACAE
jgi:hypothetical protein